MRKSILIIFIFIFVGVLFYFNDSSHENVCFEDECFKVELATSVEERSKGLMFRESLKEGNGMLFVFPESREHNFWMKNTFISLDMIWISAERRVVHIERGVLPCVEDLCPSYGFGGNSRYVLEINSFESAGIEIGEEVNF